ncbi:unnamed protein product, partial [Mesorhabditis spiculigera]
MRVVVTQIAGLFWNSYLSYKTQTKLDVYATCNFMVIRMQAAERHLRPPTPILRAVVSCVFRLVRTVATAVPQETPAKMSPHESNHALYQAAISRLNSLQTNTQTLEKLREKRHLFQESNVPECVEIMRKCGIEPEDINGLNVIHVSGTKGKGSTCAFVESMLRSLGYKTGFYSSPHLVHARERIRINGKPISERAFAENLFSVYDRIVKAVQESDHLSMPAYFKFLTILAFDVFVREKVDVAIIEVGIGGQYDCTNVIEKPIVTAITTLDYDHTSLLGNSLKEIAWHKAGIFKYAAPAIVSDIAPVSYEVMRARAKERQVSTLAISPPLSSYDIAQDLHAGIAGHGWNGWEQETFSRKNDGVSGKPFSVPKVLLQAIESCHWPGRSQVVHSNIGNFYLDGAHTPKSIEMCAARFAGAVPEKKADCKRVLLFHCTADRKPETLLPYLKPLHFDYALFCPTVVSRTQDGKSDMTNFNQNVEQACKRSIEASETWTTIDSNTECHTFPCIQSSIRWLEQQHQPGQLDVLVTGSLHLVGGVLSLVDPESAV